MSTTQMKTDLLRKMSADASQNKPESLIKTKVRNGHSADCTKQDEYIERACSIGYSLKPNFSISTISGLEFYGSKYRYLKSRNLLIVSIPKSVDTTYKGQLTTESFNHIQNWINISMQFKFNDVIITRTNVSNIRRSLYFDTQYDKNLLNREPNDLTLRKCFEGDYEVPDNAFSKETFIAYLRHFVTLHTDRTFYLTQLIKEMEMLFNGIERLHLRQTYSMFRSKYEYYRVEDCTWGPCCDRDRKSDSKIYRCEYMNPEILYRVDRCPIQFQQNKNPDKWFDPNILEDAIKTFAAANTVGKLDPSFYCTFCSVWFNGATANLQATEHMNKCFPNLEWRCPLCPRRFPLYYLVVCGYRHDCNGIEK